MKAKADKKAKAVRLHRYRYTLSNAVTGLKDLTRDLWAATDDDAKARARKLAKCFGRSTKLERVVRLKD